MRLDKFQKNAIFLAITEGGLAPADFELSLDPYEGATVLDHKRSTALFVIGDERLGKTSISYEVADGPRQYRGVKDWMPAVEGWLGALKHDLETPDLWATLQQQQTMLDSPVNDPDENTPFTAEEQQQIAQQLDEIGAYVKGTYELSGDQMRLLERQLDYLQDAAKRIGRIDWRNAVTGVLLGTVVNATLPGDAVRDALSMLLRSVGHMFGHPMPELPIGL